VTEGALVRLSGRYFVIAVSTSKFTCDGRDVMGISTSAPIFKAIEGARAGDTVEVNGRKLVIEDVA
jgi:transcription elongation GreA/GreB family factor